MDSHEKVFALFDKLDVALQTLKEQNADIKERIQANEQSVTDVKTKCDHLEHVWKQEVIDGNDVRRDQNSVLIELQIEIENIRKRQATVMEQIYQLQTPIKANLELPTHPTIPTVSTKKCCSIQ